MVIVIIKIVLNSDKILQQTKWKTKKIDLLVLIFYALNFWWPNVFSITKLHQNEPNALWQYNNNNIVAVFFFFLILTVYSTVNRIARSNAVIVCSGDECVQCVYDRKSFLVDLENGIKTKEFSSFFFHARSVHIRSIYYGFAFTASTLHECAIGQRR